MNAMHKIGFLMSLFILTLGFSQCTSPKVIMKIAHTIEVSKTQAYYQKWVAGVRGGGSGTNLYVNKSLVKNKELITAYFKGKSVKFDAITENSNIFIARFKGDANQGYDLNMEAEAINEYGNTTPVKKDSIPFKLANNDAVVSYLDNKVLKFIKLKSIPEKEMLAYPSTHRNQR